MERAQLLKNFSERLTHTLKENGQAAPRTKPGVDLVVVSELANCSIQMARRYITGSALPDIAIIVKMAKGLNVSPGWLLFGEEHHQSMSSSHENLNINIDVLRAVLLKGSELFAISDNYEKWVSFIIKIIQDVTEVDTNNDNLLKIISVSINSAIRFYGLTKEESMTV